MNKYDKKSRFREIKERIREEERENEKYARRKKPGRCETDRQTDREAMKVRHTEVKKVIKR